jgi:hypothetical protein
MSTKVDVYSGWSLHQVQDDARFKSLNSTSSVSDNVGQPLGHSPNGAGSEFHFQAEAEVSLDIGPKLYEEYFYAEHAARDVVAVLAHAYTHRPWETAAAGDGVLSHC